MEQLPIVVTAQELTSSLDRVRAMNHTETEQLADDLHLHQPVLMHTLTGFRLLFPEPAVSGALCLVGLVLWHAFRRFPLLRERRIDDELFDRLADRNFAFFKYLGGEQDPEECRRLLDAQFAGPRQMPAHAHLWRQIVDNAGGEIRLPLEQRIKALCEMKGVLDCLDAVLNEGAGVDPETEVPARLLKTDPERLLSRIEAAQDDTERCKVYLQALQNQQPVPCEATVVGGPVSMLQFSFDGNQRRGLVARCRGADGSEYTVNAYDVALPVGSPGAFYLQAYRAWVDTAPAKRTAAGPASTPRGARTTAQPSLEPMDLIILSLGARSARCRILATGEQITLRAGTLWDLVPGETAAVRPKRPWTYKGHPYLSGEILSVRLDVAALGLVPLGLEDQGTWDPTEELQGVDPEGLPEWAKTIVPAGLRPAFEMEQVIPGADLADDSDPIMESIALRESGLGQKAYGVLMDLCKADLRCLDAHAHLGSFQFDSLTDIALRHYTVGVRIGELSLPPAFNGVLPWDHVNNRPFLRCLHGMGLALWRLGRFAEAEQSFLRVLRLDPADSMGVRLVIGPIRNLDPWRDDIA